MTESTVPRPARAAMTSDEFIAWAIAEPKRPRYELVAGELVAMAPERAVHARVKHRVARALETALAASGRACEVFPDGMAVKVDDSVTYQPDALVRCGDPVPDDTVKIVDPVIVVEVLSPSSLARDTGAKLEDYFRLPSVHHYLIVKTENRTVIHHRREADGAIQTRILHGGPLELEPPGVTVAVASFFPPART